MHTARQLHVELFDIKHYGVPATGEDLFPAWGPADRLGVVVSEPFGAVGASHLIQVAITAFYDARPERREHDGPHAAYPEIYLFHVGGPHGDHSGYDFWPARREVFLDTDPRGVLDAINDRAITRLVVPEREPTPLQHDLYEAEVAADRITSAFAYSASGRVPGADWMLTGLDERTEVNACLVLDPDLRLTTSQRLEPVPDPRLRERSWPTRVVQRLDEARAGLDRARDRRRALRDGRGLATETYRSISVDDALAMLV